MLTLFSLYFRIIFILFSHYFHVSFQFLKYAEIDFECVKTPPKIDLGRPRTSKMPSPRRRTNYVDLDQIVPFVIVFVQVSHVVT